MILQNFNPRSRVGNDSPPGSMGRPDSDFNPRSRVGNDEALTQLQQGTTISIHVPAWRTTYTYDTACLLNEYFNPRSRVGNDESTMGAYTLTIISIHVPAWGTTIICNEIISILEFQSTFPRGERPVPMVHFPTGTRFQSTFPRGERRFAHNHIRHTRNFNPRSRVGNDSC